MSAIRLDDGYGFLTFEFEPAGGGGPRAVRADLNAVNGAYLAAYQADGANPWPAFLAALAGMGFPPMSQMNAARVLKATQDEIARLGKVDGDSAKPG